MASLPRRWSTRRRDVVVLFQHHLFGAAIARALGESDHLRVTTLALDTLSAQALQAIRPDAIVVEGPMTGDVETSLLSVAPVLTIVVGPEVNTAEVYERHEVIQSTVAEISARIMAGSGTKRVTTAGRPSQLRACPRAGRPENKVVAEPTVREPQAEMTSKVDDARGDVEIVDAAAATEEASNCGDVGNTADDR